MYHSITFGDGSLYSSGDRTGQFKGTNTWDDWHLIPEKRPCVSPPGVSFNFLEIPGRDGTLDLTNFITNRPVYGDRSGSFRFYVDNDHEYWETIRMNIINFLHGKRMKMCFEDDPGYYWEGRFTVGDWSNEAHHSMVTINYQVGPYKKSIRSQGSSDIIWDTFNFETDYDYYASLYQVVLNNNTKTASIHSDGYSFNIHATIITSSSVTITLNGTSTTFSESVNGVVIGRSVESGTNSVSMTGTGTVTLYFTGGSL